MSRRIIRNMDDLRRAESIKGIPISSKDRIFLEEQASCTNVISIQIGSASTFSKPKDFFVNNNTKFVFVRNGHLIPYADVNLDTQYFLAYHVKKQVMYIYGYFPGEND